ncbi:hypothetical protein DFH27DRAFT_524142 [Peziza echinospora]|nr:hypothetical protein DFH27DRAFT_524142 [Peziza echinospora]
MQAEGVAVVVVVGLGLQLTRMELISGPLPAPSAALMVRIGSFIIRCGDGDRAGDVVCVGGDAGDGDDEDEEEQGAGGGVGSGTQHGSMAPPTTKEGNSSP